jgi:hypothetical protein
MVYRYTDAMGRTVEATSDSVSGDWEEGSSVRLMVFAHRPERVRETSGSILELVIAMFLCLGLYALHLAVPDWSPLQIIAMVAGCGAVIVVGYWLWSRRQLRRVGVEPGGLAQPAGIESVTPLRRRAAGEAVPSAKLAQALTCAIGLGAIAGASTWAAGRFATSSPPYVRMALLSR